MNDKPSASIIIKLMKSIHALSDDNFEELSKQIFVEQQNRSREKLKYIETLGGLRTVRLSDLDLGNSRAIIQRALVSMGIVENVDLASDLSLATLIEHNFTFQKLMKQHGVGRKALSIFEDELEKLGLRVPYFIK